MELKQPKPSPRKEPKLVVFDVEGVIMPKNRFFFEIGKKLGFSKLLRVLFYGFLYEAGLTSLKSALKHIFNGLKGIRREHLLLAIAKVPVVPDAKEVFKQLKARGCKTALISSGLPQTVVDNIAIELGADFGYGFEIGLNDDALTGEIWGDVIEARGKFQVLAKILKAEGLSPSDCAVVADDRNNAVLYLPEIQKVGFNPDFVIRVKADRVITGRLLGILAVVGGTPNRREVPSRNDFVREAIHASGVFVPVLSLLFGATTVALMICTVIALYALSELARMEGKSLPLISTVTRQAALQAELYEFAAAPIYFALGILLALLLFRVPVSSAAIAIFAIGDSSAAIFGRLISEKPLAFNKGKTLGGSMAGFFFAFLAGSFFISPPIALAGAAVAMIVESLPLPVNDNILVPLSTGLALMFMV
jgi:dolichol kinase/phosphoserine phosphatase